MEDLQKDPDEKRIYGCLGMATKAGKISSGETQVLEAIRSGEAALVMTAGDASEGTAKKFRDKCSYYEVALLSFGSKESLGRAIGKDYRSCIAICDMGFAERIAELITGSKELRRIINGEDENS